MKQTTKYQLNLIESGDRFSPDPINENTQALEDALVTHNSDSNAHSALQTATSNHIADKNNPHGVTAAQVGAAASSHTHSAGNITSGTLPVSRGGTGNTSVDSTPTSGSSKMVTSGGVYTALAGKAASDHTHTAYATTSHTHDYAPSSHTHDYAASSHNHSASNITSGTLAVARGGTGNTSVDTAPTSGSTKMVTSGGVFTALANKFGTDNAAWVTGTYTGNGSTAAPLSINLGFQPSAVFVVAVGDDGTVSPRFGAAIRSGSTTGSFASVNYYSGQTGVLFFSSAQLTITASGFSVTLQNTGHKSSLNEEGKGYLYLALK